MNRLFLILFLLLTFFWTKAQDSSHDIPDTAGITLVSDSNNNLETMAPSSVSATKNLGEKRKGHSKGVYFFIGLATFLLFGALRFLYAQHIRELVSILSRSTLGRLTSKEGIWQHLMPRWLFLAIYFLSTGYIVGRLLAYYTSLSESPITFWLWGTLIVFIGYLFKFFTVHAVALVFRFNDTARSFFNHLSVVNQLLGLILLPICGVLMLVSDKLAIILLIVAGLILIISLIFKLLINIGYVRNLSKVSFLHFILYLCTLEFIPLAVIARYVYNGIGA